MSAPPTCLALGKLMIGGLLGAALSVALLTVYERSIVIGVELPNMPNDEQLATYNEARYWFNLRLATIQVASLGVILGACLGLLGCQRKRLAAGGLAAVGGGLLGAAGGAISAWLAHYFEGYRDTPPVVLGVTLEPMMQGASIQLAAWGLAGVGIGFGLCVVCGGAKQAVQAAVGGLLGGLVAVILHTLVSSVLFPNSSYMRLIPDALIERGLWATFGSLSLAGCIYLAIQPKAEKKQADSSQVP